MVTYIGSMKIHLRNGEVLETTYNDTEVRFIEPVTIQDLYHKIAEETKAELTISFYDRVPDKVRVFHTSYANIVCIEVNGSKD